MSKHFEYLFIATLAVFIANFIGVIVSTHGRNMTDEEVLYFVASSFSILCVTNSLLLFRWVFTDR